MLRTVTPLLKPAAERKRGDMIPISDAVVPPNEAGGTRRDAGAPGGGFFAMVVVVFAALPAWRLADLSGGFDLGITSAAVLAAAGWHLWTQVSPHESGRVTRAGGAALLCVTTWQLVWVGASEYWFVRTAFAVMGLVMVALWGGVGRGWRALTAIVIWAGWLQFAEALQRTLSGAWICERTAAVAAWLLWQGGQEVSLHGALMRLPHGAVAVGGPCTGVPLASTLLALLTVAALLLRLRASVVLRLAAVTVAIAFFVGVFRVGVLALIVNDARLFNYWHSPEGGAWFSAGSILLLAWFVSRVPASGYGAGPGAPAPVMPPSLRAACAAIGVGCIAVWVVGSPPAGAGVHHGLEDPVFTAATLEHREMRSFELPARGYNQFAWQRDHVWRWSDGARTHASLAYLPTLLTGDARLLAHSPDGTNAVPQWTRRELADGSVWESRRGMDRIWIAVLTMDGQTVTDDAEWRAAYLAGFRQPSRWGAWLMHERPLCDKRAYFLTVSCEAAQAGEGESETVMAATLHAWRQRVRALNGPGTP